VEYIKKVCLRAREEEFVVRSRRLPTAKFVGNLHALPTPRAAVWMGIGSISKKDRMKMALVCRKRDVVGAGFKMALPSRPSRVAVWMGRVGAQKRRTTWYVFAWKKRYIKQ